MCLLALDTARRSLLLELQVPFALLADDTRVLSRVPLRIEILAIEPDLSAVLADKPVRSPLGIVTIVVCETAPWPLRFAAIAPKLLGIFVALAASIAYASECPWLESFPTRSATFLTCLAT